MENEAQYLDTELMHEVNQIQRGSIYFALNHTYAWHCGFRMDNQQANLENSCLKVEPLNLFILQFQKLYYIEYKTVCSSHIRDGCQWGLVISELWP